MIWNKKFEYPASIRSSVEGKRHYEITGQKLPSVTTILSATQSAEKKKKLEGNADVVDLEWYRLWHKHPGKVQ